MKNGFNQVLNVHGFHDKKQIFMAEPLVPKGSFLEKDTTIEKLNNYKFQGTNHISAEFIKAGGETLDSEMHRRISLYGLRRK